MLKQNLRGNNMWGFSIQFWETVLKYTAIFTLILGGLTVAVSFISSWVGYNLAELTQADTKRRIAEAEARVQEANLEIARLNKETAKLSVDAESARADIAKANERAAEANQKAEEERLARVKLEDKVAWRTLTQEQQERISSKIKQFAGQQYMNFVASDPEAINFLRLIDAVIKAGDWNKLPPKGPLTSLEEGATIIVKSGISIQIAPSRASDLGIRAITLASAVKSEGIPAEANTNPECETNPGAIWIVIGSKPP